MKSIITDIKNKVNLKNFYFDVYDKSDLQKINRNNPLPHKCTIDFKDFYYYNADLSGLMWLQELDRKLKYNDFVDFYRKGFEEGLKHLKEKEGIKKKDFYNTNKKEELKQILYSFLYVRDFLPNYRGLNDLVNKIPLIWTEKIIYEQGYYNGLLHSILVLCDELCFVIKKKVVSENPKTEKKLTIKQIALKLAYEGINVTDENKNEIIKKYGHNSGDKLMQEFNNVFKTSRRTTDPNKTLKILQNKIELFESIIELLEVEFKQKAIDECKTLKTHLAKY
ncbi:hypothetical protein [Flavobacterium sp. PL002]|uniref:hypothetical protein n=1 Tax=Flavobacterium sp. PL002 TaxID=1897058 RepID=UPI001787D868|nr:hypothetical protein [Flavobacterium sp. PL002]MBE0390199.1 hypothetical protein [Flavobacterium sp. PL002]